MKPVLLVPESGDMSKKIEFAFREYGHVILTEGVFESGPIEIPSDAVLELGENAELRFIPDFSISVTQLMSAPLAKVTVSVGFWLSPSSPFDAPPPLSSPPQAVSEKMLHAASIIILIKDFFI